MDPQPSDYLTVDDLKVLLTRKDYDMDDAIQLAISAASQQIDDHCNDQFWTSDQLEERTFVARQPYKLLLPSIATTDGVSVSVDYNGNGLFETQWVQGTHFELTPQSPRRNWPYTGLVTFGGARLPGAPLPAEVWGVGFPVDETPLGTVGWPRGGRARIRVTAQWGWPQVPWQVRQACQILAIGHYKSKDLTGGQGGTSGMATGSFGGQNSVMVSGHVMDPLAMSLLCGLREPVVA